NLRTTNSGRVPLARILRITALRSGVTPNAPPGSALLRRDSILPPVTFQDSAGCVFMMLRYKAGLVLFGVRSQLSSGPIFGSGDGPMPPSIMPFLARHACLQVLICSVGPAA